MQRVDTPAFRGCARRRVHGLGDHEPAEQDLAEPVGRVTDPAVAVGTHGDELDRLLHDRIDVDLGLGHEAAA